MTSSVNKALKLIAVIYILIIITEVLLVSTCNISLHRIEKAGEGYTVQVMNTTPVTVQGTPMYLVMKAKILGSPKPSIKEDNSVLVSSNTSIPVDISIINNTTMIIVAPIENIIATSSASASTIKEQRNMSIVGYSVLERCLCADKEALEILSIIFLLLLILNLSLVTLILLDDVELLQS